MIPFDIEENQYFIILLAGWEVWGCAAGSIDAYLLRQKTGIWKDLKLNSLG